MNSGLAIRGDGERLPVGTPASRSTWDLQIFFVVVLGNSVSNRMKFDILLNKG